MAGTESRARLAAAINEALKDVTGLRRDVAALRSEAAEDMEDVRRLRRRLDAMLELDECCAEVLAAAPRRRNVV